MSVVSYSALCLEPDQRMHTLKARNGQARTQSMGHTRLTAISQYISGSRDKRAGKSHLASSSMILFLYIFIRYFNAGWRTIIAHGQTHTYEEHHIRLHSPSRAEAANIQDLLRRPTASSGQRAFGITKSFSQPSGHTLSKWENHVTETAIEHKWPTFVGSERCCVPI